MQSIIDINKKLIDVYGMDIAVSMPNYRIVWSSDEYETRVNPDGFDIFDESGSLFLRTEYGPKLVDRYPLFPDKWVLEVLVPKLDFTVLVDPIRYSYEPIWIFGAGNSNPLPIWRGVEFLVRAHKFKMAVVENKTENDLLIAEMEAIAKEKEVCKMILSNENPPLATALSCGEAIVVPSMPGDNNGHDR